MENIPSPRPDENTPEQVPADGLIEQRDTLHEVFDELDRLAAELRTNEVQAVIDAILLEHDPTDTHDQMSILLRYGKDVLPGSYYELLTVYTKLLREFGVIEDTLTETHAGSGEFAAYVREEAQKLLLSVNIMKLLHGGYAPEEKTAIALARDNLHRVVGESDTSDEQAEVGYDLVERSREILEAMHILHGSVDGEPEQNPSEKYDINELYRAHVLNKRYRMYPGELHPDAAQDKPLLPIHLWQVTLSDDQRMHLERHLRAIDVEQELDWLNIEGLELLPFALTETEVKGFLHDVPGVAFEGLTGVSIKERSAEDSEVRLDETDVRWVSLAVHSHDIDENRAEIILWADAIRVRYEKQYNEVLAQCASQSHPEESARVAATAHTINHLKGTLIHEMGHAFHNKLPVGLLHDWDSAIAEAQDDQPVSRYVEVANTLEPETYHAEDFADTFKLYLLRPGELRQRASVRYAAMHALITSSRQ